VGKAVCVCPAVRIEHQLEAFLRAVREGAPVPTGAEDAIANMTLIDAAYRAAGLEPRAPSR